MKTIPQELIDLFEKWDRYVLIGHSEPDGDCIGSQLALGKFLTRLGKTRVDLVSPGPFQRMELEPLRHHFLDHVPQDIDRDETLMVILDCSTLERIGYLADEIGGIKTAVIDHHSSGDSFGDYRFIDSSAPSVTFMILYLIEAMGHVPSKEEAQILLFGLATDTGFFRHVEAQSRLVFEGIARLSEYGASPKEAFRTMYGGRPLESKQLLGLLMNRTVAHCDGKILLTYETLDEMEQFGSENRDSDTLYQQLQGVSGCEAVVLIREEEPGICSVGLRSLSALDVGKIAKSFGGGGHALAAGFSWKGGREEAEAAILAALKQAIRDSELLECNERG